MMNAGLMTTGLTNCSAGGDPAVQSHLCATDAVAGPRNNAAETASSDANAEPNADPNVCTDTDPNACRNTVPNADPNSQSSRVEDAARLPRYRTRRKPRTPPYPSPL